MKVSIKHHDGGISVRLDAENNLESIALKAWVAQAADLPNGYGKTMPMRHLVVSFPEFSTAPEEDTCKG